MGGDTLIVFNDHEYAAQIAARAGMVFNPAVDRCIARTGADGALLGGVIYNGYTGAAMNIHIAAFSSVWINIDMLWVCFHYPFVQLNLSKLVGQVPSSNSIALEFDLKIGFKEEARVKDVFPDGDLVIVSMRREDCKWLKLRPRYLKEHV